MSYKKSKEYQDEEIQLAIFAKALGHPARIAIMKFLSSEKTCFCGDIVQELPIAQATVSQHLKELKSAGLIHGSIESPKVRYCINPEQWKYAKKLFAKFWKENPVKVKCN